jgi:hypothetical protein
MARDTSIYTDDFDLDHKCRAGQDDSPQRGLNLRVRGR